MKAGRIGKMDGLLPGIAYGNNQEVKKREREIIDN